MSRLLLSPMESNSERGGYYGMSSPVLEKVLYLSFSLKEVPWKEAAASVISWCVYQITSGIAIVAALCENMTNRGFLGLFEKLSWVERLRQRVLDTRNEYGKVGQHSASPSDRARGNQEGEAV